jgi:hypothetical protein
MTRLSRVRKLDLNHEAAARAMSESVWSAATIALRMAAQGSCSLDFDDERRIEGRVQLVGENRPYPTRSGRCCEGASVAEVARR